VGKSRLFNRLTNSRDAIVHGRPGVTRDVLSADLPNGATLLDTGGLGLSGGETPAELVAAVEAQVDLALAMADLLVFVLDGRAGVLPQDREIAERLRRTGKRIVAAVNKVDGPDQEVIAYECASLGFAEAPIAISAEHGRGIERLEASIYRDLPPPTISGKEEKTLTIALLGAPNVGKSSIANALLGTGRMIVSPIAGTTRDTVLGDFLFQGGDGPHSMRLLDTAGLRANKKISSPVEYFASLRSRGALAAADVVFLILDAARGLTAFDKVIAEEVREAGKCFAVAVNKWDLAQDALRRDALPTYEDAGHFRREFADALRRELFGWPELPLLFLSATTGEGVRAICSCALDLRRRNGRQIATGPLNRFLGELCQGGIAAPGGGKPFKLFYALQTASSPITIRLYCNDRQRLAAAQLSHLRRRITEQFSLGGCPLRLDFLCKERRSK
jgi:GTP-binding protein